MKKLTEQEKIDHILRCEFHRGKRLGVCPTVSIKEANELRKLVEPKKINVKVKIKVRFR